MFTCKLLIDLIEKLSVHTLRVHVNDPNILQIFFLCMMGHGLEENIWCSCSTLCKNGIAWKNNFADE